MNWRTVELANGLRLISIERPQTPTAVVEVLLRAGSRYDPDGSGVAHLLEHLLFKGTRSRSAREIYSAVERHGGGIEGHTAKEYARFQAVLPSRHLRVGVEILADVLTAPLLAEEDFWSEKLVVLAESQRMRDSVNYIFHLFAQALWAGHPLGDPVWGNEKKLAALEYPDLLSFYTQAYTTGNALIVLCGDLEHDAAWPMVEERFAAFPVGRPLRPLAVVEPILAEPRLAHLEKDLHQTHLVLGFPTVGMKHEDSSPLAVIERVLGMGGSARLFQRLREQEKLVYNASTVMASYEDAGYLAAHATCRPENVPRVRQVLLEEFDRLGRPGITVEELAWAKSNYEGALARRLETNLALADALGVRALLHQFEPPAESVTRIKAVTREDVRRAARRYFRAERHVLVTVGHQG